MGKIRLAPPTANDGVVVPTKLSRGQFIYAYSLITSLFFAWGFAYGLLDSLNKWDFHVQAPFFCWCYLLSYLGIFNRCLGLPKPNLLSCRYRTSVSNFVSMNVPWNPSHVHFRRVFSLGSVRSPCSVNYSILTLCSWAGAFMRRVGYKVIVCLWEVRQYYWTRIWKNGIYAGLTMYSVCGNPTYQCTDRLIARCTAGR